MGFRAGAEGKRSRKKRAIIPFSDHVIGNVKTVNKPVGYGLAGGRGTPGTADNVQRTDIP